MFSESKLYIFIEFFNHNHNLAKMKLEYFFKLDFNYF